MGTETIVVGARRRGIDARLVFAVCVVTVLVGALISNVWPAAAAGPPSRPIDRTIDQYVLFALDSLSLKGGNPDVTTIDGGDVGVNNPDPNLGDGKAVMSMCTGGSGHDIFMADGSQANADTFDAGSKCSLWDVYSNQLNGSPVIRNSGPTAFTTPIIAPADLPAFPVFACDPANPVTVQKGTAMNLAPGTYGAVQIKNNATLTLAAGTYTFCDLGMGANASFVDTDGTIVQVEQSFAVNGGTVGPSAKAKFFVRGDGFTNGDAKAVTFGRGGTVAGTFWVPFSGIALGHSTDLTGHFWAQRIVSDFNIQVHGIDDVCVP